ncbi:uncharacterized protein BP01DRAFT_414741 [Aspergillus saccharolyticus JOP 1030-1]|uniref:Uncharacterized protein n=1 Tax=Aspergillus saccharolyticus JOP 1030-1 TaxID=1450539 RepID=A0A318ZGW5_9EURO|nr:hypothetical protein BP01DRAFT_414741 [Aspergillus saccharolyticus JOP 1030-1]PYH46796.1 hypothetical protein BP01DRAFT_414741 [Aspergillus saccharolyticus JOP 1030-1]
MVVFVDYDHDGFNTPTFPRVPDNRLHPCLEPQKPLLPKSPAINVDRPCPSTDVSAALSQPADSSHIPPVKPDDPQYVPNRSAFSAALSCYPIIKEIARAVDLNTLHALSRTCRQFHANMAPYRSQLIKQTLRCENEYVETVSDMLDSGTAIPDSVKSVLQLLSQYARVSGRITTGKVAKCARDMVAECRRCSKVVCRNCTIKPPPSNMYKNRIRRLCTTCRTAPLTDLIDSLPSSQNAAAHDTSPTHPKLTAVAIQRTPCDCYEAIWLCQQCGHRVRSNDTTYRRVWTWRTRYSTYLGGLGTGIGEGCQGVKCGRGEHCLAAKEIELEVECEADEASGGSPPDYSHYYEHRIHHAHSPPRHTTIESWDHREEDEPGYFRQEIIGIGGRVKQKAKKRIVVGACVVEHEDERETGEYLTREEKGEHRSWCGWCWRVIPAKGEVQSP